MTDREREIDGRTIMIASMRLALCAVVRKNNNYYYFHCIVTSYGFGHRADSENSGGNV